MDSVFDSVCLCVCACICGICSGVRTRIEFVAKLPLPQNVSCNQLHAHSTKTLKCVGLLALALFDPDSLCSEHVCGCAAEIQFI